ncbi:MAG: hypothetical protein ACRDVE_22565 [Actinocrinis sp.]
MPEGHGNEGELSEPKRSLEETLDDLEELIEEYDREVTNSFAARNREQSRAIARDVDEIELDTFNSANLDAAQQGTNEGSGIAIADGEDDDAKIVIDELRTKLSKATMELAKATNPAKALNLQRFLVFNGFLATSVAVSALIYTIVHALQTTQPAPAGLPQDTETAIRDLVREWNSEPDDQYWDDLASYVTTPSRLPKLTLADQILFMSYTIDLSPAAQFWVWDRAADIDPLVSRLVDEYNAKGNTAAMYLLAPSLKYKDAPIPRGVMATLLRWALARILVLLDPGPAAPVPGPTTSGSGAGLGAQGQGRGHGVGEGEDPLSEPPDEPETEAQDEADQARAQEDGFAARNAETAQAIVATISQVELTTLNCDNVDLSQSEPVAVANTAVADATVDRRLTELEGNLTRALDTVAKNSGENAKQYNVTRYIARFLGVAVVGVAAIVLLEYLTRGAKGQSTDDLPPVPADTQQNIHDLVEKWRLEGDSAFWESLAAYVGQHPGELTGADQVLFLNYTIELCPPADPFIWDSQKDKTTVVESLVATAQNGSAVPAMYRALSKLTYQGAALPRAVAADCARLAVAWIAGKNLPPKDGVLAVATRAEYAPLGDPAAGTGGISGIPIQLRPRVYVAEVAPGVNAVAYARSLQMLLRPAGLDSPAALSAAAAYRQPATSPYRLLDPAQQIAALPAAAQDSVKALIAKLTGAIEAVYPMPAGETTVSSRITCLSEPVFDLPAGTVVYERTTDRATVQFVLPQILVDPATGAPSLRRTAQPVLTALPLPPVSQAQLGGSAVSIALSVAGNLAWILPPPWGPVAAAGFTLIQLLLGTGNATDQFAEAVKQLEQFIDERDVNRDATAIKSLADWLQQQSFVLGNTRVDNSQYITSVLLPELHKMVSPGDGSVYSAIYDLEGHLDLPGAFDILVLGVTIHLLALKMIVQLDAQLASSAKDAADDASFASYTDLWLADYANFLTAIKGYSQNGVTTAGWAVRILNHISAFENARLSRITEPYRYNDKKWVVAQGGGATGTSGYWVDNWGWTYRDAGRGDSDTTSFVGDYDTSADCCGKGGSHTEYRQLVQNARDQRVQDVSGELDKTYGDATATVKVWLAMIQQWNEHLPPRPPTTAPKISGWNGTAPQGGWTNGSSVAYAVAFANASGPSQPGPWSAFTASGENAFPTLTDLPTDPLGMAANRWIYRRFLNQDGTKSLVRIIGVTDAVSTTYVDKKS